MVKITNEIIAVKIDSIKEELLELKKAEMLNTEFRLKANGIVGGITFLSVIFGGFIMFLINKFWK